MTDHLPKPEDRPDSKPLLSSDTIGREDQEVSTVTGRPPSGGRQFPQVPGYQLVREISRGGQAVVFECVQESTGRAVAIKLLHAGALVSDSERARFEREVQILASLDHPNIVQVIDRGELHDGAMFLAMAYVQGKPLDKWLAAYQHAHPDGPPRSDPASLLQMFLKITDAVNAAHLRGIVHRDLKPANILVDQRDEPRVLDFGLARPGLTADGGDVTITGQFVGSLPWASPEQAEGLASSIDTRTDVYALGVILYQMLTGGRFPYVVVGNMAQVLNNIVSAQPSPPSQVLSESQASKTLNNARGQRVRATRHYRLNPAIDAIVLKALAKRRDDRYQTAGELARDITNYLSGKPTVALGNTCRAPVAPGLLVAAVTVLALAAVGAIWLTSGEKGASSNKASATTAVAPVEQPVESSLISPVSREAFDPEQLHAALRAANPDYTGNGRFYRRADGRLSGDLGGCKISDLSPLAGMPFYELILTSNHIRDLSPLRGMPLVELILTTNEVADLSPLEGMPLERLGLVNNSVHDLEPLTGMPLKHLILQSNPIDDLTPLRGLQLQTLNIVNSRNIDLLPLQGMPITILALTVTPETDLSPLHGMPVKKLNLTGMARSYEPFFDMPLTMLSIVPDHGPELVAHLAQVQNHPLRTLVIKGQVEDLTFIRGLNLTELSFTGQLSAESLAVLREMKSLEIIDDNPGKRLTQTAEEFWAKQVVTDSTEYPASAPDAAGNNQPLDAE